MASSPSSPEDNAIVPAPPIDYANLMEQGINALKNGDFSFAEFCFRIVIHGYSENYGSLGLECASAYHNHGLSLLYQFPIPEDDSLSGVSVTKSDAELEEAGNHIKFAWQIVKGTQNNWMDKVNILSARAMQWCMKAIKVYQAELKQLQAATKSSSKAAVTLAAPWVIRESCDEPDPSVHGKKAKTDLLYKVNALKFKLNHLKGINATSSSLGSQQGTSSEAATHTSGNLGRTSTRTFSQMAAPDLSVDSNLCSSAVSADETGACGSDAGENRPLQTKLVTEGKTP